MIPQTTEKNISKFCKAIAMGNLSKKQNTIPTDHIVTLMSSIPKTIVAGISTKGRHTDYKYVIYNMLYLKRKLKLKPTSINYYLL